MSNFSLAQFVETVDLLWPSGFCNLFWPNSKLNHVIKPFE